MASSALKGCPFCGHPPELYRNKDGDPLGPPFNYECVAQECGCLGPPGKTIEEARDAWNRRWAGEELVKAGKAVLEWYDRDGSVGGLSEPMSQLELALEEVQPQQAPPLHAQLQVPKGARVEINGIVLIA